MSHQPPPWDGRSKGSALGNRIFMFLIARGGIGPAYLLLKGVAAYYALFDRRTIAAIRDFRAHLGLTTRPRDLFCHIHAFGACQIDRYAFLSNNAGSLSFTCRNEDRIVDALKLERGVILVGAHVGNWELGGNLLCDRLDVPVNIVVVDNEDHEIRRVFERATRNRRVRVIALSPGADAVIAIAEALRRNEIVCMHGDRVIGDRRERLEFLGAPAWFPTGPFETAGITGAPLIPTMVVKAGPRAYGLTAFEPLISASVPAGEREAVVRAAMERYVRILEETVRGNPLQWHNFYRFWD